MFSTGHPLMRSPQGSALCYEEQIESSDRWDFDEMAYPYFPDTSSDSQHLDMADYIYKEDYINLIPIPDP